MGVEAISSLEEFKEVIADVRPAVVDFWASWCGPCRAISPIFEKHSEKEEFKDIRFYKVDVDAQADIAREYGIRAMPSFHVYQSGERVGELVGAVPAKLEALLRQSLTSSTSAPADSETGEAA